MTMTSSGGDHRGGGSAPAPRIGGSAATPKGASSRIARLSSWLGGDTQARARAAAIEARRASARHLFARIGDFLSTHDLPPTNANFRIARAYVLDEDPRITRAIDAALDGGGTLDADLLDMLAADDAGTALNAARVAAMAETLAHRLSESERVIRQGHASTRDYEIALTAEADALAGEPGAAVARLIDLTAAALARTQELAERLDETRRETESLRSNLAEARRAADEDHLTGLPNRRCFDARLQALIATGNDDHCVALCDIDDFKGINDRHGHQTGDRVLRLVAGQLVRELGPGVFVARHGGEEFACLFERVGERYASDRLDAAREALAARTLVNQTNGEGIGRLTFSAGVAVLTDSPGAAMRAADEALYLAKRRGKNRVVVAAEPESGDYDG